MNFIKLTAVLLTAAVLAACGGGGGSAGTSPFNSGGTTTITSGDGVSSSTTGSIVLALSSSVVSSSSPGVVTALVRDAAGTAIKDAVVTFSVSSPIATVSPGSALTSVAGQAAATLTPVPNSGSGAAYVNASVELPNSGGTLTTKVAFSVNATNVTLTSVIPTSSSLSAYASTAIAVVVSNASSSAPVTVTVGSTCTATGKASISPATLVMTSTTGSVTYQDNGCAATDTVNVQISGTTQQLSTSLVVAAPSASSLQFISSTPDTLSLFGSGGGATTATVTFRLIDQSGTNGIAGQVVDFVLDQPQAADLGSQNGTTDSTGYVTVSVSSKAVPSPVRVTATLHSAPSINTVSNALTIKAGRPYQDGISLAATAYSLNYNLDGDNTDIRLQLVDRFGNPVPDGTVVNLVTEGGSVVPASCSTLASTCSVKFVVSNPRPADGRVQLVAFAQGEEVFVDSNTNNVHDSGEPFTDLGPVTLDKNENSTIDPGETIVGAAADSAWNDNGYVRYETRLFMSKTAIAPRLYVYSGGACTSTQITTTHYFSVNLAGQCRNSIDFCLRDGNAAADSKGGNPVVSGATLAVVTNATGATVGIDNSPVPAVVTGPTHHVVTVGRSSCATPLTASGTADLSVNLKGNIYTFRDLIDVQ